MLVCPNQNSPEFKSWEKAGISKEQIYTEYVLNNYALPMYSQDINKALTVPEIKNVILEYSSLSELGIKDISALQHGNINAVGAYFKDVLYFSEKANQKTISEETGHAMLQKFADPATHKLVMDAGKQLLETRLKAEGRTLEQYLKSIQTELGVSESKAEEYAQEEEFMKDYALYDSTGTQAQDLRKINELTEKLSFLGPVANKVAKAWIGLIKGLKQLFSKPDEITHALELIRSLKQNSQTKYHRGYNVPSFMYIPKDDSSTGVSPFSYQKIVNDVAATYYNRYQDLNNYVERIEEIFEDFTNYYNDILGPNNTDNELVNLLYASTALEYDDDVTDDIGNVKDSTRTETLKNVISALKTMGVNISEEVLDDSDFDINESELGGRQGWDQSANEKGVESLSLGLKNIILRVGKKLQMSDGKILTFAPDVSHIYSGLVRYSSKSYNTTDRFKRMVEFSNFKGNESSKLLIQDYFLEQFKSKATYKGNPITEINKWIEEITSDNFVFEDLVILDPILGQEFVTLTKGLELVSRDMRTMKLLLGQEISEFSFFDTNSSGIVRKLKADYTDKININFIGKLKRSSKEFNDFFKKNQSGNERDVLISMLSDAGIRLTNKVEEEISNNLDFGQGTFLQKIVNKIENAVNKDEPLLQQTDTNEDAGSLNSLIAQVIDLQIEYDETILENAFTNMDGKTIYAFQRQTPIILTLRNLANKDFLDKFKNGSPYIGQDNIWSSPGFKNNPIIEAFQNLSEQERKIAAQTFSLDGLFSQEGDFRDDVSFSDMDDRHFAASALNLMVASTNNLDKKLNKYFTAVTLGHNEASSLIDFNNVPVFTEEQIKENLQKLIIQEFDRITLVKTEIEKYITEKGLAKTSIARENEITEYLSTLPKDTELTEEQSKVIEEINNRYGDLKAQEVNISYEDLKEYYRDQNIPVYKGMLDGRYVLGEDGKIDIRQSKVKSFEITKNLKDIITIDNILAGNLEIAEINLNNVLEKQLQDLKQMNVIEILDKSIVNFKNLSKKEKENGAVKAFNFSENIDNNIKNLLKQFWMGSTFSNQILVGDASISFKNNLNDILKRHRSYNAALLGVDIPFSVPSLNIFPKSEVKMILTESDEAEVYGNSIDKDDAQSYSSLDFWLYKQFSKAKLTANSYEVYLDVQAGIPVSNKRVEESGAYFASDKTITAQGNQIIKHSEHHILPTDVAQIIPVSLQEAQKFGYKLNPVSKKLEAEKGQTSDSIYVGRIKEDGKVVINKLVPMEHRTELFNLYAMLQGYSYNNGWNYSEPIDIKSPTTASKGAQKNVLNRQNILEEFSKNPAYYTQSLAANTYGDQVENPQGKNHSIDPSQNQEIKINEIENAQDLVEEYLNNHAQRNNFEIDLVMKELYGAEYSTAAELDAKQFLDALTRLLKDSGTDNQKLDFFSYKQIGDKFVANYNLNLPPIRQKFTQSLFKMFTRALRHKVAGNSLVQVSSSDYNLVKRFKIVKDVLVTLPDGTKAKRDIPTWDVVNYEEYINDDNRQLADVKNKKYNGKNLVDGNVDELTTSLLEIQNLDPDKSIYFFDEVRFMKPYINESNELEFFVSETIMPKWFDGSEEIPEALKLQYGVRIPSQDKQTSIVIEWVKAFGPEKGNSIIVPKEIIFISGSDFDIDKLFTQRPEGYFEKGEFKVYADNIDDFRKYMFAEKKFFKGLFSENEEYKKITKDLKLAFVKKEIDYREFVSNKKEFEQASKENLDLQIDSLKEVVDSKLKNKSEIAKKAQETLRTISILEKRVRYYDSVLNQDPEFNQDSFELEEKRIDTLEEINDKYNSLFNLYSQIGFNDRFKNNKAILDNNKKIIDESSTFAKQNKEIQDLKILKERIKLKVQNSILAKYNYPTIAEEYKGNTYPAIINNRQLRISQKLLSEPEIVYGEQGSIYETPATVEPYKKIFERFIITVPKNSKEAKKYSKRDYFSKEEGSNINFYPYKTKLGESIFTKDKDNIQTFSLLNFSMYQKAVQAAKAGIGLLANANVLGIFGKRLKMKLISPIIFEGKEIYEFQFKTEKDRRVFDAISTTISVTTDEAKESQLSNHEISSMDLKVMSILMLHGLDIEDAFAVTRSKGAKDYNNLLARQKITREKVFKSNVELIASYLPDVMPEEFEIKREELIEENQVLNKKYFMLYDNFLSMYGELSKLIPAVKLKTGLANDVPSFMKSLKDISDSDNSVDNFNYYSIGDKSIDFENSVDIYNTVNKVASKELVEMNPLFTGIQNRLESSITSRKKAYSDKILKYIDQFLLGTYAKRLTATQSLFENRETFKQSLLDDINKIYQQELPETDPFYKALNASKDHLRTIVRVQGGELRLNFEGKLNQKLKDLVADSWLLLKNSPIEEVRAVADGLFKYYFLKDALQYTPGSLELVFPASKFKDISKVYDSIIRSTDEDLMDEFITYFAHLPETSVHLKNNKNLLEAFDVKDTEALAKKAIVVYEKIKVEGGEAKVLKAIQMNPKLKDLPRAIKIGHTKYLLAPNNAYYPIKGQLTNDFNTLLTGSDKIAEFHNTLKNKREVEKEFVTTKKVKENPSKVINTLDGEKDFLDIYSKLGNKTQSENVVIKSWGEIKDAIKAITLEGIISTRIKNTNEHFGNPFSHDPAGKTQGLIKTETIKEAVEKFTDWVINSKDERANWIREQLKSGELKGKPILYYKELGEPSHATALDYLINKYDWTQEKELDLSMENVVGEEISSMSDNLAFALTNPTFTSPKGYDWSRTWTPGQTKWRSYMQEGIKFEGIQYKDVEEAYQKNKNKYSFKTDLFGTKTTDDLMLELLKIKLQTYPKLVEGIISKGGIKYLEKSTHQPTNKNSHWETKGDNAFIKLLTQAFNEVNLPTNNFEEYSSLPSINEKLTKEEFESLTEEEQQTIIEQLKNC